ncbi:MAG: prolipoprotein diacylglyceryl transferase [Polyangiales bacterium]
MRPELFRIFGEPVPAYFTLLCIGFALAIWFTARWAERNGLDREVIIDLGLLALVSGIVGSRLLHVFADGYFWDYVHMCTDPSQVGWHITRGECSGIEGAVWDAAEKVCRPTEKDCFAWAAFWNGGLTYYGGLLLAVPACVWFLRREGFPVLKVGDVAAAGISLGLFWGRMGCFLGGCCFGRVTDDGFPLAVRFPAWSPASEMQFRTGALAGPGLESLPVHPTQLYEAFGSLAIAAFLAWYVLPRKRFDGMVLLAFLALYSVLRFVLEFWRADDRGGMGGLSTSQLISLGVVAACAAICRALWARRTKLLDSGTDLPGGTALDGRAPDMTKDTGEPK